MSIDVEFLRALSLTPGPSGFEGPVQRLVRERLARLAEPQGDALGNVWATVNAKGVPRVVVTGHADQIGLIVTFVDEQGFVRFDAIGGVAAQLLPGRHVVVHAAAGPVQAVVGRAPTHVVPKEERDRAPDLHEQFLDIGAKDRDEALSRVAVGDPVTFAPDWVELVPGTVATQALDDRAGVYVAVRALELYAGQPAATCLTALSTVHEETTFMGARARSRRLEADVIVVVDGDFASDTPAADARKLAGEVSLGAGPVLARGPGSNEGLWRCARETAAAEGIPVQVKAFPSATDTDADELMAAHGAAVLSLGLPMRSMHSPYETAALDDIERAAELVAALTRRLADGWTADRFVPSR